MPIIGVSTFLFPSLNEWLHSKITENIKKHENYKILSGVYGKTTFVTP